MKILIIRFSSIGDIVLTTPVIRCLKKQIPDSEIHFITKENFKGILQTNPYIGKLFAFSKEPSEIIQDLKNEKYDLVIDLHKNIRSIKLKTQLFKKSISFHKANIEKWLTVNTKKKSYLPSKHIVDRYFDSLKKLNIVNDFAGLDFFISKEDKIELNAEFKNGFAAIALGAQFATKKLPAEKLISICKKINRPVVLLGGKEDVAVSQKITEACSGKLIIDYCGRLSLRQSAYLVQQSKVILTHDTGLMHIAAAFKKPIVSVWGNTIPEFGMYPYMPDIENGYDLVQVENLNCRPCSKIGFQECPKKHFNCMIQQDEEKIISLIEKRF